MPRLPTAMSALPAHVLDLAEAAGMDRHALISEAGLDPRAVADPEGRIPIPAYAALIRACAEDSRSRKAQALAAQRRNLGSHGIFSYILANSRSLFEGFSAYERYACLLTEVSANRVRFGGSSFSIQLFPRPPLSDIPLFNEGNLIVHHAIVRTLLGESVRPVRLELPHARHAGSARVEELLDAPAVYGQSCTVLHYSSDVGRAPIPGADPLLGLFLERHAASLAAQLPKTPTWSERTRKLLLERLPERPSAPHAIARELALSPRTLQRRLSEEGTAFAKLLDDARRELALAYVADLDLPLSRAAFLLGYSGSSAFNRAFRRWAGQTPAQYRRASLGRCPMHEAVRPMVQ